MKSKEFQGLTIYYIPDEHIYECVKCPYQHMEPTDIYNHYYEKHAINEEMSSEVMIKYKKSILTTEDER